MRRTAFGFAVGRLGVALSCFAACAASGGAYLLGRSWIESSRNEWFALRASPEKLHFGARWAKPDFRWAIPITNVSSRRQEIAFFRTSCSCTEVSPGRLTIPPGATREIVLTIDLTSFAGEDPLSLERQVSVEVTPFTTGDSPIEATWHVTGVVRYPVLPSTTTVYFREPELARASRRPARIALHKHALVSRLEVATSSPLLHAALESPVKGLRPPNLVLTPDQSLPAGSHDFQVRILAHDARDMRIATATIFVHSVRTGDLYASPDTVVVVPGKGEARRFESIAFGSYSGRRFRVENVGAPAESPVQLRCSGLPTEFEDVHVLTVEIEDPSIANGDFTFSFLAELENSPGAFERIPVTFRFAAIP